MGVWGSSEAEATTGNTTDRTTTDLATTEWCLWGALRELWVCWYCASHCIRCCGVDAAYLIRGALL